ncbi:hypothetical protein SLA2020_249120 [Shorea laevis]
MACIKAVNRSASVALAPEAPYMAAGTMAGAVDLSFSSSANLEIFKLDFQSDDRELPVVGECPSSERFNRLAWGRNGSASDDLALGLIAGGHVDGNIDIWNPLAIIRSESSENAFVGHLSRHRGPVRGLEFNIITPNLLASGADDGEVCIWDLAAPSEPSHFPPLKGSGSAAQGEISFLSWNCKVQHILASTSYNGTTAVWDLRKQKPIISFSDSVRRRCSVLQWNPDLATQLIVSSDEDDSPSLRLWDMRNIMSPVKEFAGHTKGVIAMSWCPTDSSYLITCAKDNRTICWDTVTGEIACELPAGTNWNFDIHWYPKIPGVISASSFDGKIGIYNIEGCSRYGVTESDFGAAPLRAPKWYKRPVGASFSFGGKLVSFHPRPSAGGGSVGSEVFMHNLVTEESLVSRSSEFEAAIQNGDRSSMRVFCEKKSLESESEDDQETWGFLKVMFEDDGTARTKLLMHLGFSLPTEEKDTVREDLAQGINGVTLGDKMEDNVGFDAQKEAAIFAADNGEDFFNNLPSPKADTPVSASANNFTVESSTPKDQVPEEHEELEDSADLSFQDAVQHALVVGNYKGAVALCVSANKMADALVIAHVGGTSLWETTRDRYLKMNRSPYLKIVSAMVNNDLMSLVNTRPLKFWKETLALLCTFAQKEEWTGLCDTLASKLMAAGNTLAATLCYICAGNIDKTVEIWSKSLANEQEGKSYVDLLQDLMEKTIVLALATGQKRFSAFLCKLVEKYAEILASQGLLTTALEYLKLLGSGELSPELVILKDRITLSTEPEKETKSTAFDNSQLHSGSAFEPSQQIYQDSAPSQIQRSVPTPYNDNFQHPFSSYVGGYAPPATYQPQAPPATYQPQAPPATYQPQAPPATYQPQAPPANVFVPSQAPHVTQANFGPPPATTQPAMKAFVPSNPPGLRNAGQYQQAPTLGSQLYPAATNPTYPVQPGPSSHSPIPSQGGSVPGLKMPQVTDPTTTSRAFVPMTMQPSSPTQQPSVQPAVAPVAPPPTVQTVDTSNVPVHYKPVITTLTRLFHETSEALGGSRANPAKKREIEDNSRKIGALFAKLNTLQIQVNLTTTDWDECNFWLATLKRMIKTRQNVR